METFLPRARADERAAREQRARSAAEELTTDAASVRFDRSLHLLEDEICFYVFAAPSARDAEDAARRAGLDPIRVLEAAFDDSTETEEP